MRTMLREIDAGEYITIGTRAEIYRYTDGGIVARLKRSGLMSPEYSLKLAGLRRALAWIDGQ